MQILDYLLGHNESALFRRAQLKALVSIHGREVGSTAVVQDGHLLRLSCESELMFL